MCLAESFESTLALGVHSKETIVSVIIPICSSKTSDGEWYGRISDSFKSTIINNGNTRDWLTHQFKQLGIYQASDRYQGKEIPRHHCMTFIFDFLNMKQDSYFCERSNPIRERTESYLKQHNATPIIEEHLKIGDLILYKENSKYTHIALSLGKINGKSYAISKFGEHAVFIHTIDSAPENYGEPKFFTTQLKLNSDVTTKFEAIKKELLMGLSSTASEEKSISEKTISDKKAADREETLTSMVRFYQIAIQPLVEFKQSIESYTAERLSSDFMRDVISPLHFIVTLTPHQQSKEKLKLIFAHAKRLKLDPNIRIESSRLSAETPFNVSWDNTPLHHCIAYENYDLIPDFLSAAKEYDFKIDLDAQDKCGKTPLMLAIQMSVISLPILKQLITTHNYNKPDHLGRTPIMIACAMRRLDVAQCLIQFEANRLELGVLDFSSLTKEQRSKLSPFINQKHMASGKSLGHFAVLRHGSPKDQAKDVSYQETVLNILKAVGVDGNRDFKAYWNAITNEYNGVISTLESSIIRPAICHINGDSHVNVACLSSKANQKVVLSLSQFFPDSTALYIKKLLESFEGITVAEVILKGSSAMVEFLHQMGVDFSAKQSNGKTPLGYIEGLHKALEGGSDAKDSVTRADREFLIPLRFHLKSLQEKYQSQLFKSRSEISTEATASDAKIDEVARRSGIATDHADIRNSQSCFLDI